MNTGTGVATDRRLSSLPGGARFQSSNAGRQHSPLRQHHPPMVRHPGYIVEVMANQQPLPEWPVRVEVQLAPKWVRIPNDPRPQGRFLKYDPCGRVAQQLIRAGQVNKLMLGSSTEYLRRMSVDNLTNLWLGAFIEALSPESILISTLVVLPPVETAMTPHGQGEVDYEELRRRAATKNTQGEFDRAVQPVEFPWGRGYRSLSRRPHSHDRTREASTNIE
jgi:hypothetical protein